MTPQLPYHAFVDGVDLDYPYAENPGHPLKLPVIVIDAGDDGVISHVTVVAPDGEEYVVPDGLLYLPEPERVSPGPPERVGGRTALPPRLTPNQQRDLGRGPGPTICHAEPDGADPELERVRNWLRTETIWRVEMDKPSGQTPRIFWYETTDRETEENVRQDFREQLPQRHLVSVRRATEDDAQEALSSE